MTETGVVSHLERDARETAERPPGGVSDLAAALARAGQAGVAGLASLAASFGTASSAEDVAVTLNPKPARAPPSAMARAPEDDPSRNGGNGGGDGGRERRRDRASSGVPELRKRRDRVRRGS